MFLAGKLVPNFRRLLTSRRSAYWAILLVATATFFLTFLKKPTSATIWEFRIDGPILACLALAAGVDRRRIIAFRSLLPAVFGRPDWKWVFLAFVVAFVVTGFLILSGYFLKAVDYQGVDNPATFCLSVLLDLPAIAVFSLSTIFLEELLFRGILSAIFDETESIIPGILASSCLWALLKIAESESAVGDLRTFPEHFIALVAFGSALCAIASAAKSLWASYTLRIAMTTIVPIFLSGSESDQNSFFVCSSPHFAPDGWATGGLFFLIFCSWIAVVRSRPRGGEQHPGAC